MARKRIKIILLVVTIILLNTFGFNLRNVITGLSITKDIQESMPFAHYYGYIPFSISVPFTSLFRPVEGDVLYLYSYKGIPFSVNNDTVLISEAFRSFYSQGTYSPSYPKNVLTLKYNSILPILESYNTHIMDVRTENVTYDNRTSTNPSLSERVKAHNGVYMYYPNNVTQDLFYFFIDSEEDINVVFDMLDEIYDIIEPYFYRVSNDVCDNYLHFIFIDANDLERPNSIFDNGFELYGNNLGRDFHSVSMPFTKEGENLEQLHKEVLNSYRTKGVKNNG